MSGGAFGCKPSKVGSLTRFVLRQRLLIGLLLLLPSFLSVSFAANPCAICHPDKVEGYSHSAMAHSLRRPSREPEGSFEHSFSGTKFTIYSNSKGFWQRMERGGEVSEYRVDYVIGSGKHASGYLVRMGDHLFQSPICYYPRLKRYDMAPGYEENRTPDFVRAVTQECLLCHSGKPRYIEGTLNEYQSPAFAQEAISCDRCHGDPTKHLKAPLPGSIVNPAKLAPTARNSVCEQCHLRGVVRVVNPGKKAEDFHAGEPLEQVFTIYTAALPPDSPRNTIKVISHAEQLALSLCARRSAGHLWCGTCHDPHDLSNHPAQYYRARCLSCHRATLTKSHPQGLSGNCVSCHMPKRNARDGGHTVFTDHRISRHPEPDQEREIPENGDLVAWREPPPALRQRNLGLAYVNAGLENRSEPQVVRGYQMLAEVANKTPDDPEVLKALGLALLGGNRPLEAAGLFERVLKLRPDSAIDEGNAGSAWAKAGQLDKAVPHLERALELDPLLLPVAQVLVQVYRAQGETDKLAALADHVRQAMQGPPSPSSSPQPH
jgi:hypothetical protein